MQTIDEALGKKRVICLLLAVSLLVLGTGCSKLLPQEEDSLAVPLVTPASDSAAAAKPAPAKPARKGAEPMPWYFWLLVFCAVLVFIAILVQTFSLMFG